MKRILEELYFGNVKPNEQCFQRDTDYARAIQAVADSEKKLTDLLDDMQKEWLWKLMNAQAEINGITAVEKFIQGFRLGTRITMEAVLEDRNIFVDL